MQQYTILYVYTIIGPPGDQVSIEIFQTLFVNVFN